MIKETKQKVKDWGGIAAAVAAIWLIVDKIEVPDSIEPATVQEVENGDYATKQEVLQQIEPLQQSARAVEHDLVLRNIPWALNEHKKHKDNKPSEYSKSEIHDYLCGNQFKGVEGEYRRYQRLTGSKHRTEGKKYDCN